MINDEVTRALVLLRRHDINLEWLLRLRRVLWFRRWAVIIREFCKKDSDHSESLEIKCPELEEFLGFPLRQFQLNFSPFEYGGVPRKCLGIIVQHPVFVNIFYKSSSYQLYLEATAAPLMFTTSLLLKIRANYFKILREDKE